MQANWKWCWKCQGMFYSGNSSQGVCPADRQPHDGSRSSNYMLSFLDPSAEGEGGGGAVTAQDQWRWCSKCQGLYFSGNPSQGRCPADNLAHGNLPSYNYVLVYQGTSGLAPATGPSSSPENSG